MIKKLNDQEISFNFQNTSGNLIDICKSSFNFKSAVEQEILQAKLKSECGCVYTLTDDDIEINVSKENEYYYCIYLKAKSDIYTGMEIIVSDNKTCSDFAMKLVEGEPKPEKKDISIQTEPPKKKTKKNLFKKFKCIINLRFFGC